MQFGGLQVQDPFVAIASLSIGLLGYERHGVAFIEQPQLSIGRGAAFGVHINTAFDHIAVKIGDQRADIA